MEDLKNIRHFDEFKDAVNEELLWDAIKNLFSKIFGNIDKKLADKVAEFTKKLDASKDWNESVRLFEQSTKDRQMLANQAMTAATGPLGVRKVLYDNSCVTFLELQEMSNKYQSPALAAKKIFEGQPEAEMFNFDKSEDFVKNAVNACNDKMIEINKTSQSYNEQELSTYLKNNSADVSKVEESAPAPSTTTPAPSTGGAKLESIINTFTDIINEERTPEEVRANPTPPKLYQKTVAQQKAEAEQQNTKPANNQQQQQQQQQQQGGVPKGDVAKLKDGSNTWMTTNLYGYALTKLKQVKAPAAGAGDPVDTIAKGSKATKHPENLAKLLRNIINIPDANTLANVRNAVATAQKKNPAEFEKEIGLF